MFEVELEYEPDIYYTASMEVFKEGRWRAYGVGDWKIEIDEYPTWRVIDCYDSNDAQVVPEGDLLGDLEEKADEMWEDSEPWSAW